MEWLKYVMEKVAHKYIVHGCTYALGAGNNLFSSSKYMQGLSGALLRVY